MEETSRREKVWNCLWFLGWALASSVWCLGAAFELGATFDEPLYLQRGLQHWRSGSHGVLIRLGTMPLPVDVETGPLYLWERCQGVEFDPDKDAQKLLPWARAGTLVFWWLLLLYGWKAGRLLAGKWGARLAVALLACEPSLLAHASLATTDIAVSACVMAFVYHFRSGREQGWWRRVALPGLWFGLASLSKASGLVFCSICLIVLEFVRVARLGDSTEPPEGGWRMKLRQLWTACRQSRRDFAQIVGIGLILTFLYCGSDWQVQPSFVAWANQLPEGSMREAAVWTAENLRIFSNAGEGIVRQVKHNIHGHGVYILGHTDRRALWYYFPLLLTIKLSTSLLLTVALLGLLRIRALGNWATAITAVLLLFSLTWRVQIGIRLALPLVVVGIVGLATALAQSCRADGPAWKARLFSAWAATSIVWTAGTAIAIWPNGLCFVNGLWGGTENGYLIVSEANYDWGQGLRELSRWQQQYRLAAIDVWYFGTDPLLKRLPMRPVSLHALPINGPEDVIEHVRGHYLAVSTTLMYGNTLDNPDLKKAALFLRNCKPVARTTTFLIYDFTGAAIELQPSSARSLPSTDCLRSYSDRSGTLGCAR
jgi:hypothetical protein